MTSDRSYVPLTPEQDEAFRKWVADGRYFPEVSARACVAQSLNEMEWLLAEARWLAEGLRDGWSSDVDRWAPAKAGLTIVLPWEAR